MKLTKVVGFAGSQGRHLLKKYLTNHPLETFEKLELPNCSVKKPMWKNGRRKLHIISSVYMFNLYNRCYALKHPKCLIHSGYFGDTTSGLDSLDLLEFYCWFCICLSWFLRILPWDSSPFQPPFGIFCNQASQSHLRNPFQPTTETIPANHGNHGINYTLED